MPPTSSPPPLKDPVLTEAYIHPSRAFEQTGTTFAFLTLGAAAIIYAGLKLKELSGVRASGEREAKYEAVDLEETHQLRSGTELKAAAGSSPTSDRAAAAAELDEGKAQKPAGDSSKPGRIEAVKCSRGSLVTLMGYLAQLGGILMYSWFCENMPVFDHGKKSYSRDVFWFITLVYIGVALATVKANPKDTSLLNREQTEEWKGWMQFLFLMYHYFHASEVYNAVRVFISCYVWMTGFGNFSFFYIKRDFGFVRFWQMMWRLNFLVFWLIMVHGNTFILYYINPLHTFYFLLVFVAMYIFSSCNHDKWPVRVKMIVLGTLIFIIWDVPGAFHAVFGWLSPKPTIGAKSGTFHEWHFRSGLDHYSAIFGMAFAMNYPMSAAWLKAVEKRTAVSQWLIKGGIAAVCAVLMLAWTQSIFSMQKLEYNKHHPYWFWIPLLVYIFIRNISFTLRSYHLGLLTRMGKITLETYLMQHHIWLTSNAKTLLVFIPGSPLVNFFFVSVVYLYLSYRLFRLTVALRAMLIPNDAGVARTLLLVMLTTLSTIYGFAQLLTKVESNVILVLLSTLVIGIAGCFVLESIINAESVEHIKTPYLGVTGLLGGVTLVVAISSWLAEFTTAWGSKDQNNGGVAGSVSMGLIALAVFSTIVLSLDNFVGLSRLSSIPALGYPSWEEAYSELHNKIFSK